MRHSLVALGLWAAGCLCGAAALAESSRLQPDFTFRRVGVPQHGSTGGRITVQIDPNAPSAIRAPSPPSAPSSPSEPVRAAAPAAPGVPTVPRAPEVAWFWQAVSPAMEDSGPGRLQLSLTALDRAPDEAKVRPPALQGLSDIARAHGTDILRETVGTRVSPALVLAVIAVESGGRIEAVSGAGAQGLMQLMPDTASRFGVTDSLNPSQNIRGGVRYLDWLMEEFATDPILVLAGYNAGEGSVRQHGGVPPFAETRAYVPKVLAAWTVARGLCVTPPQLVTDGCVFAVDGGI
ncbi:lytic transglycosylase domain-containing protein [Histidinibacterium aquaticum]|uniref:Lytic transglycosylase domain-containing protein n=1 Tax=Histidinibacterium aquaticum TaxID=2613962 RepID=A0A5J5GQH3_9RHOB|nr:lytic transglycosylase domain-containing protein [Histidinibacterium aquaticum]KAA9010307.1 lytic transglycosylase domain-containing protein [Histidinibacterium aquaticum]